ncbi:MAG: hypothetical protein RLZZ446_562, partial [Bacteroidota bacterium]
IQSQRNFTTHQRRAHQEQESQD